MNIWAFGDSLTYGYACRPDDPHVVNNYYDCGTYYKKYKKNKNDIWTNILSKKLGINCINLGENGASNDKIFDAVIEKFNYIKKYDLIILGKTLYQRFDVPDINTDTLKSISAGGYDEVRMEQILKITNPTNHEKNWRDWLFYICDKNNKIERIETIVNFSLYFAKNKLYEKRQNKRFDFIKKVHPNYIEWSINDDFLNNIERIADHTDGAIKDKHFSFNGHEQFASIMIEKIKKISFL
jgi:hypothetical protein